MANVKITGMFHVKHLCKCGCVFMKSGGGGTQKKSSGHLAFGIVKSGMPRCAV